MRRLLALVATVVLLGMIPTPTAANPGEITIPCLPYGDLTVQEVGGTVGPGAEYLLYVPAGWQPEEDDLVVYAHGYVSTGAPVGFYDPELLAQITLIRNGLLCPIPGVKPSYAVAVSSYSENGFAVKKGAQQTHQVGKLFTETFGEPRRTYLMGASLGGAIVTHLAEKYGSQYDGTLAMCGFVGGSQMQVDYIADVRNAFDYFYPGSIPRDALNVPAELDFEDDVVPSVFGAIEADLNRIDHALMLAGTAQIQLPLRGIDPLNPLELVSSMGESLLAALYYNIDGTNALLDKTHGRSPYDNTDTVYYSIGVALPSDFNQEVKRFSSSPDAKKYLDHWFSPTGKLKHPLVTLHTTLDPAVPYFHEAAYAEVVSQSGASNLLQQIAVVHYGHCAFTPEQVLEAFIGLATWVENGMNPWELP